MASPEKTGLNTTSSPDPTKPPASSTPDPAKLPGTSSAPDPTKLPDTSSTPDPAKLPDRYPVGHSRVFDKRLRFPRKPLAVGGSGQVYICKSRDGEKYLVKMYEAFTEDDMARARLRLARKKIIVSDADIDSNFNLWHRECRVYEHIDEHIKGPERSFFPKYYGSGKIPFSSCPAGWRYTHPNYGDVSIAVLELLDKPRPIPGLPELKLREPLLMAAKQLYSEVRDCEYIHILLHLYEIIDILHEIKIIHADIKPENLIDYSVTTSPVLFDFSISWVQVDGLICLDRFKRKPRTFEERRDGELGSIRHRVLLESKSSEEEQLLRKKFPNLADCQRCATVMKEIIS